MKQPKCGKHGERIGKIALSNSQILDGSAQFKAFKDFAEKNIFLNPQYLLVSGFNHLENYQSMGRIIPHIMEK